MPETRARGTMAPAARKTSRRRSGTEGTLVSRSADAQTARLPGILRVIRRIMACWPCRHSPRWVRQIVRSRRRPMRRPTPWCLGLVLLVLTAGCAGRDFTRPAPESLVLGKTTYAEINGRLGSPYREATVIKNEKTLRVAS